MAANDTLGLNQVFQIYHEDGSVYEGLVMHKATTDSVVMSLGDSITGDVYWRNNELALTMKEYITYNGVNYVLVNPPTIVREGMVADNSELKGMTKYSFKFYHPMYQLGNFPFSDVAVTNSQKKFLSENKTFSWIGNANDYLAKLNKNLDGTQWKVEMSSKFPAAKKTEMSEVLSFDKNTIAEALKVAYETWGVPYVVDVVKSGEAGYSSGKRFKVVWGLPSNEIYESAAKKQQGTPYIFKMGQGVGLKNNSRTPRNNKIITRIAGYGSETNIPYGYPQIVWTGDQSWDYTVSNKPNAANSYPIYDGIVGGQKVRLIKHPFTRPHLMPTVYVNAVNKKVNPNASGYSANTVLVDYYDATAGEDYPNPINLNAPSYDIHEFDDIKPELGNETIVGVTPLNPDLTPASSWDDTMDDDGNYIQSYFQITLPTLSFDIYACAAITEAMEINMRSGACLGCTFPVEVDWEDYKANFYNEDGEFDPVIHSAEGDGHVRNGKKYPDSSNSSTPVTLILKKENTTFGTLMPNTYQHPATGDQFVVLGISLPTSYITSAQTRLDNAMKSFMLENNVHYYDYPLKFDEAFLRNNTYILEQLKPNAIVRFEFAGETLPLYVKQMNVKFGDGVLPKYDITLTDNVEVVLNQIGQVADDVERLASLISILRQSYGSNVWVELAKKLSKTDDDTAQGFIRFVKGLQVGERFVTGLLGEGGIFDKDADGKTYIEADKLYIRMKAYFDTVEIRKYMHSGGNRIASPAGAKCIRVDNMAWYEEENKYVPVDDNGTYRKKDINDEEQVIATGLQISRYRCYFRGEDNDGDKVTNDFVVGDQAYCHITNGATNALQMHHYWRLIVGTNDADDSGRLTEDGEFWIDLAATLSCSINGATYAGYQSGSDIPKAQDDIVQLGNVNDSTRRGAIIEFVSGNDAPSYQIFQDLGKPVGSSISAKQTSQYSLENKNYIGIGVDSRSDGTKRAYMNVYGDAYIGDPNESTYIRYEQGDGTQQNPPKLEIKAKVKILSGSTVGNDSLDDYIYKHSKEYDDTDVLEAIAGLEDVVGDLQDQIDGNITTIYGNVDPSIASNDPYKDYTENEKEKHLGDMYYNSDTGYAYRYDKKVESGVTTYFWQIIRDTGITQAIAEAGEALNLAGTKAQIFTTSDNVLPQPPYNVNDIWVSAKGTWTVGGQTYTYDDDILKCVTKKPNGSSSTASITDWVRASKYTDDSSLTNFINFTYDPENERLHNQIDGKIDTYFTESGSANDPSRTWTTTELKEQHLDDVWYQTDTDRIYRYIKVDNGETVTYRWDEIYDEIAKNAYRHAAIAQDTADGKRRVFTAQPTIDDTYEVGDLWVNANYSQGNVTYSNDILRCQTNKAAGVAFDIAHWKRASKYTDDTNFNSFVSNTYSADKTNLQNQIDGKYETWFYEGVPTLNNDPAKNWNTTAKKNAHLGDLYWDKTNQHAYRFVVNNNVYSWQQIGDNGVICAMADAAKAQDTADNKRRVFVSQPAPPYDIGDLWAQGEDGDIMRCTNAKTTGDYSESDWEQASKYTSDAVINTFLNGENYNLTQVLNQIDQKAETWYQDTDPTQNVKWGDDSKRVGDMWLVSEDVSGQGMEDYKKGTTWVYQYDESHDRYYWARQDVPQEVFDYADGKCAVYVNDPNVSTPTNYHVRDLWILPINGTTTYTINNKKYKGGEILTCTTTSKNYNAAHWVKKVCYTDDSTVNAIIAEYGDILNIDSPTAANVGEALGILAGVLKQASTDIDGGLVLTSAIYMRDTATTPNIWAGISGVRYATETGSAGKGYKGYGTAAWYGGSVYSGIPVDKECLSSAQITQGWNTHKWAKSLFRFDGSGYLADANITWDASGAITIKNITTLSDSNNTNILNELATFNSAFSFSTTGQGSTTVLSITPNVPFTSLSILDTNNVGRPVATQKWVNDKFMTIAAFERLFNAIDTNGNKVSHPYSNAFASIKAMVGFWTNQYISAFGQNSSSGGGGSSTLAGLSDVTLSSPQAGQALVYRDSHWVNEYVSQSAIVSIGMTVPTGFLVSPSSINSSGTFAISFGGSVAKNKVLASPSNAAGAPSWRALVAADIPNLAASKITSGQFDVARIPDLSGTYASASYFDENGNANVANKLGTTTVGGTKKPIYLKNGVATALSESVGTSTKGVYMNSGTITAMTYSLGADLNNGTANYLAYYSAANTVGGTSYLLLLNETNSVSKTIAGVEIVATGVGNAADVISGVAGNITYGDAGPQIRFTPSSTQHIALVATHYDNAGGGASLHLVSDQTNPIFVTPRIKTNRVYLYKPTGNNDTNAVYLEYDSNNNGVHLVGAGFYSDSYVSAFGANSQSGGGGVGDVTWDLLESSSDTHQIALSHLTTALSGYITQKSGDNRYLSLSGGTMSGHINMGTNHYIRYSTENGASMIYFDGERTVVGSIGNTTTKATHFRSKTGHLTVGSGATALYNVFDTGNLVGGTNITVSLNNTTNQYEIALTEVSVGTPASGDTTYTKVFVDSYGRVTKATTLASSDIPNLPASKITSGTFNAARIPDLSGTYATSSRVTTLEGYFDNSGSANTAVALKTSRDIWGQSFNGTDNVKGDITVKDGSGKNVTNSAKIKFHNIADGETVYNAPYIQGIAVGNNATYGRKRLGFFTTNATTYDTGWVEAMSIAQSGNVGINNTSPSVPLDVNGYARTTRLYLYKDANNSDNDLYLERDGSFVKLHGNFYATGAVSAFGANSQQSGGVGDVTWEALASSVSGSTQQIHVSHLAQALSGYVTTNTTQTVSGQKTFSDASVPRLSQTSITSLSTFTHATNLIYAAAGGGNTVEDKPEGVGAFGVLSFKTASGYYGQILMTSGGVAYTRSSNNLQGNWNKLATDSDLSNYLLSSDISAWAKASTKPTYSWSEITSKPTTFTPPTASDSELGGVKIGTTMAISSNGVINQKSGIVTAGTYRSVTVDTYGRVTAGTNPTTLSGYGITDAVKNDTTWWGQSINNGAVSGNMTDVGTISASGNISVTKTTTGVASVSVENSNGKVALLTSTNRGLYDSTTSTWIVYTNGTNTFLTKGNIGIGTTTPAVSLDVKGDARVTKLYLYKHATDTTKDVYLEYVSSGANKGVHLAGDGFYSDSFISAFGANSQQGGGVGDVTWDLLASSSDTHQIALSHLTTALSGYATTSQLANYLPLTGGIVSGTIAINYSGVDFTQPDNGVSSSKYPGFYVRDKNGKQTGRFFTTVSTNGNLTTYMYSSNYDTNGTSVGEMYIGQRIKKDGTKTWLISDAESFRSALGLGTNATSSTAYLPLAGGTMTGNVTFDEEHSINFDINRNGGNSGWAYTPIRLRDKNDTIFYRIGVLGIKSELTYGYIGTGDYDSVNNLRIYPTYPAWGSNTIWHAGNDGSDSGLDADLLDGLHANNFFKKSSVEHKAEGVNWYRVARLNTYTNSYLFSIGESYNTTNPTSSTFIITTGYTNATIVQVNKAVKEPTGVDKVRVVRYTNGGYYVDVHCANTNTNGNTVRINVSNLSHENTQNGVTLYDWTVVSSLATDEVEVATATVSQTINSDKLSTSRNLWGRPFDGSTDVSGDMTDVGSVTMSGDLNLSNNSRLYLKDYGGTKREGISFSIINEFKVGSGVASAGYNTTIYGASVKLAYRSGNSNIIGFILDSSGNVGIGTTNTSYKLDVSGTFNASGDATIGGTLGVTGATTLGSTLSVDGNTTISGTLGVTGATTLSSTLSVSGNTTLAGALIFENAKYVYSKNNPSSGSVSTIKLLGLNASNQFRVGYDVGGNGYATYIYGNSISLLYSTSRTTGFILDSSGNVGIGTDTPAQKLDVNGTFNASGNSTIGGTLDVTGATTADKLVVSNTSGVAHLTFSRGSYNYIYAKTSGGSIAFIPNGNSLTTANIAMIISNSSNVGIGSASSTFITEKLSVNGNIKTATSNGAYIQIGGARIVWDNTNKALKVIQSDNSTAANFYATGSVAAFGANTQSSGGGVGDVTWEALATAVSSGTQQIDASHITNALSTCVRTTGAQNISGAKTFTSNMSVNANLTCSSQITCTNERVSNCLSVGSSTLNMSYNLYVNGTSFLNGRSIINGISSVPDSVKTKYNNAKLCVNGNTFVYGTAHAQAFDNISDMRLKTVTSYIDDLTLTVEDIARAPIFNFTWNYFEDKREHVGTSAQYWLTKLPNVVDGRGAEALSMDYSATAMVSAVMTARKVKNHEDRITELENENKLLKEEIRLLKAA